MKKSVEIVKFWNAKFNTRYQIASGNGDSSIVCRIESLINDFGEDVVSDYFNEKMEGSVEDIWNVASSWLLRSWKKEHDEKKKAEESANVETANLSILSALSKELVKIMGNELAEGIEAKAKASIDNYVNDKVICKVVSFDGKTKKLEKMTHEKFDTILKFVGMNEPVMLVGPAGSGKNVICEQIAEALDLPFYFTNAVSQEYKLTGYGDAMGNFVETQFYKWCVNGGVFMFDEIDASSPEALIVVNGAIANGYFDFPVKGRVELNKNCRIIACANTWGTGASMVYVARNQLDGASLDRFATVRVNYDERIEKLLAGENEDLLAFCREYRRIADKNGCNLVVSYRAINRLHNMIDFAKLDVEEALETCLIKGLEKDTLRIILNEMSVGLKYRAYLKNIVEK